MPGTTSKNVLRALAVMLLVALAATSSAGALTVTAQIDRPQLAVGESTLLSIEVSGTQNAAAPDLLGFEDFQVQYLGPATQMRFENGRTSSSITHRYQLIPRKPGRFTLGPFDVVADGAQLRANAVVVEVSARGVAAAAPGQPELHIEARLGRTNPFVGERVPLTIRVLIPNGVRVDDLQFPVVAGESLAVGAMPQPNQRDERVAGQPYRVLYFDTYLMPMSAVPGEVVVTMAMNVVQQQRRARRGIFDMFGDALGERRAVELRSDPVALSPRALPVASRPPDFAGAVGTFDLEMSASPTVVNAGDPVTVRVVVTGGGDLSKAQPPHIADTEGFRVYDPVAVKDAGEGRRAIEQVVIPQSPQVTELPPLSFSFFDPAAEAYRTVHRGPIPLQVAVASGAPSAVVSQGASGRPEQAQGPLGRDIVYIKGAPGDWRAAGSSWLGSVAFWLINLLPAAAVGFLWVRLRRENLLAGNPRLRRFRSAEAGARTALAAIATSSGDGGEYFDALSRALREYLGNKLGLPPGAVEGGAVSEAMRAAGYGESQSREVESLLAEMESLRYSPGGVGAVDRHDLIHRVQALVDGVEKRKDITEKLAKTLATVLLVAVALAASPSSRQARAELPTKSDPVASFFAANQAFTADRHTDAVALYREALASGEESGALHFNLGNAQFKSGDVAAALASYLRAARLLPRDPDVAANLSFAEESLELSDEQDPLWLRVIFVPAYRASEAELAIAVTAVWLLFCGALATAIVLPRTREPLRWVVRIGGVLVALLLANLVYRNDALELWNAALVTAPRGASVRFEPSEDGTEHFAAPPGTRLTIAEERNDWSLVARQDGLRGWVKDEAIVRLR